MNNKIYSSPHDAVFKQFLVTKEYEVVIVNDGSTNGNQAFLDNDKNNKNNVVVSHQENKSVSAARKSANFDIIIEMIRTFVLIKNNNWFIF